MAYQIFGFPETVSNTASRIVAAGVVATAAVAIGTGELWLAAVLAYGFVARVLTGPRLSPLAHAALFAAARIDPGGRTVPGPPKRFAQSLGAAFSLAALGCALAGAPLAATVILAVLIVPAGLEAALGYCVGCELFSLGMRVGLVPESVCVECADIYSARARARRLSRS